MYAFLRARSDMAFDALHNAVMATVRAERRAARTGLARDRAVVAALLAAERAEVARFMAVEIDGAVYVETHRAWCKRKCPSIPL